MQILITHGTLARTRVLHFNRWQLAGMLIGLVAVLTLLSGTVYHFVFLKAAREGWPVVSQIVRLVVRDDVMRSLARNSVDEARVVLVHELVHALQDQHLQLGTLNEVERDSDADKINKNDSSPDPPHLTT